MSYYHSPHCADCDGAHPRAAFSFHYLIPLSKQLTYFLYESSFQYSTCQFDLLKTIRSSSTSISTFIVISRSFHSDLDNPICQSCDSGLCPLLAVCLDDQSPDRRKKSQPFECLCVEELQVEDEFVSCQPMSLHQPMYSTRCNHVPSFWNYVTLPIILATSYVLCSVLVMTISTIFLMRSG